MKKYGKLSERIHSFYSKNDDFAAAMNMNPATLSKKLNGKSKFKDNEIADACYLLQIPSEQIHEYFFYI